MILDLFLLAIIIADTAIIVFHFNQRMRSLDKKIDHMNRKDAIESAPKFRIRTAESDPNRRATVKFARVRAIKYITPPPRR
jgi:hypothetical protein